MARLSSASAAGLFSVMAGSTAVLADVSPEDVWEAWQAQYSSYGYQMQAESTERAGDTLEVRNLTLTNAANGSSMEMVIPEMDFTDAGDGTVAVSFSDEIKAVATSEMVGQPTLKMDIAIRKPDAEILVSGTPEVLSYAFALPKAEIELDQTAVGAEQNAPIKMLVSLSGIEGVYDVTQEEGGQSVTTQMTAGSMKLTASGADPQTNSTFVMEGELADLSFDSDGTVPEGVDMENMGAALAQGFSAEGTATHGAASYTLEATAEEGPTNLSGSAESGSLEFALSSDGLHYGATSQKSSIAVQNAQLPVPVEATLEGTEFDLLFPISKSDSPVPFAAKISLLGLSVSEGIWAMFDPQAILPRDPATLEIDLSGKAKPLLDLFSPEAAQSAMPPMELDSVSINTVQLALAGADFSGTGALTFDNSMGMPMPLGAIDLKLAGANKLMDNLVAMGLLPQEQVMFVRMMLGLYAIPAGDDLMTSKIEFKEGGAILANGQRIQ